MKWTRIGLFVAAVVVGGLVILASRDTTAVTSGAVTEATTAGSTTDGGATDPDEPSGGAPDGSTATTAPEIVTVPQIAGDPREDVPSALDDRDDPTFPEPLIDPQEIRSGGPPPDGIPPIDAPTFERASGVDWLNDVEPVLILELDGETHAYPVQILIWHEIVNDTFGSTPVTVSYCPLCNSAIAYDRRVGERVLDFGTSGSLFNSSLVMYDRQTESLWSHFTGEAVVGTLTGTQLSTFPVSTVAWETFRSVHPDGLVLSRETGFARDYGRNPYVGYDDVNAAPFLFDGVVDGRLAAQTRVVVVRTDTETIAVVQAELADARVLHTTVGGADVVLLLEPGVSTALEDASVSGGRDVGAVGVFDPTVDGQRLTFEPLDEDGFSDVETGSTWDILGRATAGPLAGTALTAVEHLETFWFAIGAFEPDIRVVSA